MTRAVVDVGSGSVLLTVARHDGEAWRFVDGTSEMTFLGEGAKQTGRLGEVPMVRTLAALRRAKERAGDAPLVAAATMAVRIAANRAEFLARAAAQGTPLRVLSGEEEAAYGFRAVVEDPAFAALDTLSIVDPGGQSTELTVASRGPEGWQVRFSRSYPLGTLGLRGGPLADERPDLGAIMTATHLVDETIGTDIAPADAGTVVALGAPATDLVTLREGLADWRPDIVHGAWLDYEEVGKAVGWLMRMTDAERQALPGMEPGRGRTIHAGCLILERFLNALAAPGCRASVRGWRHALLMDDRAFG